MSRGLGFFFSDTVFENLGVPSRSLIMAREDKQSHAQGKTLCLFVRSFVCLLKSDEILRDLSFSQW
jgi:hypothetical protein